MTNESINVDIKPVLTREQEEYDKALKSFKIVTARLRLSQEGINTYNISQQKLYVIIKSLDEIDSIQREFNVGMQAIQQEADNKMRELQAGVNKKFADAQNRYRELMNSIKVETIKDKKIDNIGNIDGVDISGEKEKEIQKMLADELAKSQKST